MEILAEITDEDVGLKSLNSPSTKKRIAARAILLKDNKIALLNVTTQKYHKLPGGGLENKESVEEALSREMIEETGCKIKILSEIGTIIEHRTHLNLCQTSHCYIAKVLKEGIPKFDKGELDVGYKLEWRKIESAINIIKNETPLDYEGKFIVRRDLIFINAAKKKIDLD